MVGAMRVPEIDQQPFVGKIRAFDGSAIGVDQGERAVEGNLRVLSPRQRYTEPEGQGCGDESSRHPAETIG